MIEVKVKERADGKFDVYVEFGGNHEAAMNTSQGYDSREYAEQVARRLFSRFSTEPVKLIVPGEPAEMIR